LKFSLKEAIFIIRMIKQVERFIKEYNLIKPNDKILVAVSGGPDSIALVDLLVRLRRKMGFTLILAHYNHKIRKESDIDEKFVRKISQKNDLRLLVGSSDIKIESEQQAREQRYGFLYEQADKYRIDKIALAHNLSDQLETVVFNLIRGTGIEGLSGIKAKKETKYILIRPLLEVDRERLIKYLNKRDLKFRVDKSNARDRYSRNYIRNQIIPTLLKINPNLKVNISNQVRIYQSINKHLKNQANSFLVDQGITDDGIVIDQDDFLKLDKIIKQLVIRASIDRLKSLKDIQFIHLEEILSIFNQASNDEKIKELKGLKFVKKNGKLKITER
jgi:tRNA(Ile)-lysidine synthase